MPAFGFVNSDVQIKTSYTLSGIHKWKTGSVGLFLLFLKQKTFINPLDLIYLIYYILITEKSLVKINALNKNTVNFLSQCLITQHQGIFRWQFNFLRVETWHP